MEQHAFPWADVWFGLATNRQLLYIITCCIIILLALFCGVRGLVNRVRKGWESAYFVCLCVAVCLWAGGTLALYTLQPGQLRNILYALRYVGLVFVPGLVCLHTWKQVSYKEIEWWMVALCLAAPATITIVLTKEFSGFTATTQVYPAVRQTWSVLLFYFYTIAAYVKSYLLCLNVFYQMPQHMRRSAYCLFVGISAVAVGTFLPLLVNGLAHYDCALLGTVVMLVSFSDAFRRVSSANVIVTSRDFVLSNLSTMILVLSCNHKILDWNQKGPSSLTHLPQPRYKEPFAGYRRRILQECGGRVSPHGENIIITMDGDTERHYLISTQEVRQKRRQFGHLVEISEVTKVYAALRYLEEMAVKDQLTGLYNRNAYLGMVNQLVKQNKMPLLVLVGDINNLKRLNDTKGHLAGDLLLTTVSDIISKHMPPTAFAGRIGGDEFVVLVPYANEDTAHLFIKKVTRACAAVRNNTFGAPGVSWGYAVMQHSGEEYNDVFARADAMMYTAKKAAFRFRSSGFVPETRPPETGRDAQAEPQNDAKE